MKDNFSIADWRHDFLFEDLLVEADQRIKQVKKIIETAFSDKKLDEPTNNPRRQVNGKPDTTWMEYYVFEVRHFFGLMSFDRKVLDILVPVAKIAYLELGFNPEDEHQSNADKLSFLQKVVAMVMKNVEGEGYKWIIDHKANLTYQNIVDRFAKEMEDTEKADSDKANNTEGRTRNEHYKIIPIVSFEEAHKWVNTSGTGRAGSALCFTSEPTMWNAFTSSEGSKNNNKCFLLLRDDWQSVPIKKTEGYPKDSYGLSMIWVFVSKFSGELAYSNVRWNHGDHSYNNVDHMFTPSELADLLGMSYNKAFSINVDKDYFNKSLQALFDNNLNVAKQYFKLIVPVYEGYTFIVRTTDIRYYARSPKEYYQIPDNSFSIEDGADFYPIAGAGVNASNKISIFNFKTLKIEKEDIAKLLIPLKGIPVYGGKVVQYQSDMFYIRTEDSSIHKVPVPGTGFSIKDGADFYTIAGVNASNKISIFNFKTLKIEKEDLAKFLMSLKGIPVYGGKVVKYQNDMFYVRTEDSSIHKVPVPGTGFSIEDGADFYTIAGVNASNKISIFNFKTLKIEKEDLAKFLMPLKGIPVYGGKVVKYQNDMFYVRTEDSSIHKVPKPGTGFSIEDGADFYTIAGVNASNKISIFNFKTLKIEKEDLAKFLMPLKGIPVYGGKVVKYQNDMFYVRTEDSSIHKVPKPGTGFSIEDGADFYT